MGVFIGNFLTAILFTLIWGAVAIVITSVPFQILFIVIQIVKIMKWVFQLGFLHIKFQRPELDIEEQNTILEEGALGITDFIVDHNNIPANLLVQIAVYLYRTLGIKPFDWEDQLYDILFRIFIPICVLCVISAFTISILKYYTTYHLFNLF